MTATADPPPSAGYLARDYAAFRALAIDHLARTAPNLARGGVASLETVLVEAMAYVGDYLSYYQDAVGTEAYLQTARQRPSVARHARLLGYRLVEGCSARTLVAFETAADGVSVARGTAVLTAIPGVSDVHVGASFEAGDAIVFETLHPVTLHRAHNRMTLADDAPAPAATDRTTVIAGHLPSLAAGDLLVLAHEPTGWRWPVRLRSSRTAGDATAIDWHADDALPPDTPAGGRWMVRGNVALADHGHTVSQRAPIDHPAVTDRPLVHCRNLAHAAPYPARTGDGASAYAALRPDPQRAVPAMWLSERPATHGGDPLDWPATVWTARRDLLDAGPDERAFVPEPLNATDFQLRFGDGQYGRRPQADFDLRLRYRSGCGAEGNIAPDTIAHVADADPRILRVNNPLPGSGGVEAETLTQGAAAAMIAAEGAPQARCVTEADYAAALAAITDVQACRARRRTVDGRRFVDLDVARRAGRPIDTDFAAAVTAQIAPRILLGDIPRVRQAQLVRVAIDLSLAIDPAADPVRIADMVRRVLTLLSPGFGTPLTAATVLATVLAVPGVTDATCAGLSVADAAAAAVDLVDPGSDGIVFVDPAQLRIQTHPAP